MSIEIGSYVNYKDTTYIVTARVGGLCKILNPLAGQKKLQVSLKNLSLLPYTPARQVQVDDMPYLVTIKDTIISLRTGRVVYVNSTDHMRKRILAA